MTEEENNKRLKDVLRVMDEYFEENKPPTLKELLTERAYNKNKVRPNFDEVDEILKIVENWLPKEDPRSSYDTMQWNKCVKTMKDNLFPKKGT